MMYNYFSLAYWFNARPEPLHYNGQRIMAGIIAVLVIIALVIFMEAYGQRLRAFRDILKRMIPFCLVNALIALALLFFNYELIPFLRARIWYIIWAIIAITWKWLIIRHHFKRRHHKNENVGREAEIAKYLP